jgi:hypothetical protein
LKLEQTVKELRAESNERVRSDVDGEMAKQLEAKDRDIATLKKQAEGLTREFNQLADKHEAASSTGSPKKEV